MLVTASNNQIEGDAIHARRPSKRLRGGASPEIGCADEIEPGAEAGEDGERGGSDGSDGLVDDKVSGEDEQVPARTDTPDDVPGLEPWGVGEDANDPLMYSLERRFLSQQVLETPAGSGNQVAETLKVVSELGRVGGGDMNDEDKDNAVEPDEYDEDDEYDEPLFRIKSQLTYERGNSHSQFSFDEVAKENTRDNTDRENSNKDRKSTATGAQRGWETPCFEGAGGVGVRSDMGMWRNQSADDLRNVGCRFITSDVRTAERGDGRGSELGNELRSSRLQELQIPSSSQDLNNDSDAEVSCL